MDKCGFLGASPDGLLDDTTLIEVKCPFKYRNDMLRDCLLNKNDYILNFDGEHFNANRNHDYFHQIQGQLNICNMKKCILILWTEKDYLEFNIDRDDK